jgi:hypothetical protein
MTPFRQMLLHGSEQPAPEQMELRAGPLTLVFEPALAFVRYVRLGDREILRGVYAAVRDRNWGTVPPRVSNLHLERTDDSFHATFDVECQAGEIDFSWRGTLAGEGDGTLTFRFEGTARSTFLRNRIGFCVLHPMRECAGQPCTVEEPDGSTVTGSFPDTIAPHQPFFNIQTLSHEVVPGVTADVRFAGDIFEMEDQRNWTDASYKTYCTPLAQPYPVEVTAGTRVEQSVTLRLQGTVPAPTSASAGSGIQIQVDDTAPLPLPHLGLGTSSDGQPLGEGEVERLRSLNLAFLRVDLDLAGTDWSARLAQATAEARSLNAELEVALFVGETAPLEALAEQVSQLQPPVVRWLVFDPAESTTPPQRLAQVREHLAGISTAPIGGGANTYFVQLNRGRPAPEGLEFVSFSINPQVHAFDDASLVETLETQAETVRSAQQLYPGKPVVISPITLRARFNPDATGSEPTPAPGELPRPVDPRQASLFGAGWTLGSLKYLAESGVASFTYYETVGPRGVMEHLEGAPFPDRFPSLPGAVYPLFHVLADYGEFAGGTVLRTRSSHPLQVESLALQKDGHTAILLANMTGSPQQVRLSTPVTAPLSMRLLDEANLEQALCHPAEFRAQAAASVTSAIGEISVDLPPYAYARLDC